MSISIFKNSRAIVLTLAFISIIPSAIFIQSCSYDKEKTIEDELVDSEIINSTELEQYIIAGADLQQSLANISSTLNKIDFSTLEVDYNVDGWKKVVHIPRDLINPNEEIEEKVQILNEKKEALLKKFPQFSSLKRDVGEKYFRQCVESSINVSDEFLRLGINTSRPLLKSGPNEANGSYIHQDQCYLYQFLGSWVTTTNPDYQELWIMKFQDGTYATYQHPDARPTSNGYTVGGWPPRQIDQHGQWYYSVDGTPKRIVEIGHTHIDHSYPTPGPDHFDTPPGVQRFIYYNYNMYYY